MDSVYVFVCAAAVGRGWRNGRGQPRTGHARNEEQGTWNPRWRGERKVLVGRKKDGRSHSLTHRIHSREATVTGQPVPWRCFHLRSLHICNRCPLHEPAPLSTSSSGEQQQNQKDTNLNKKVANIRLAPADPKPPMSQYSGGFPVEARLHAGEVSDENPPPSATCSPRGCHHLVRSSPRRHSPAGG